MPTCHLDGKHQISVRDGSDSHAIPHPVLPVQATKCTLTASHRVRAAADCHAGARQLPGHCAHQSEDTEDVHGMLWRRQCCAWRTGTWPGCPGQQLPPDFCLECHEFMLSLQAACRLCAKHKYHSRFLCRLLRPASSVLRQVEMSSQRTPGLTQQVRPYHCLLHRVAQPWD